ncbi:MAG: 2-oxoisovalerate dehydrogenase [Chloroflexota bacterium]
MLKDQTLTEAYTTPGRHREVGLSDEQALEMYKKMVLARTIDERVWTLGRMGKVHFVLTSAGHEAAQVGAAFALRPGYDWILPYYRDLALVLTLGLTPYEIMVNFLGRRDDPCSRGRQMPVHWSARRLNIVSGSSPVGTQVPHAAGVALACKLRREDRVTFVSFGEGATSTGDWHEGMNFAGIHQLPVIFFCENNGYAISVPYHKQVACDNVADRAPAYRMAGVVVDGMDPIATYAVVKAAVDRARSGGGPSLIEAKCYRFTPHSSADDDRTYRSREEVEAWRRRDPIVLFKKYLMASGLLDEELDRQIHAQALAEVDEATDRAEACPYPDISELYTHVYAGS